MALVEGLRGKAGYEFTVKVDRDIPVGPFRVPVRIHTSLEGGKTIEIEQYVLFSNKST